LVRLPLLRRVTRVFAATFPATTVCGLFSVNAFLLAAPLRCLRWIAVSAGWFVLLSCSNVRPSRRSSILHGTMDDANTASVGLVGRGISPAAAVDAPGGKTTFFYAITVRHRHSAIHYMNDILCAGLTHDLCATKRCLFISTKRRLAAMLCTCLPLCRAL
jgi:hypothetical protein